MTKVLIIGGSKDQEILWMINLCKNYNDISLNTLFVDKNNYINWDINNNLILNDKIIKPNGIYMRQNIHNKNNNELLRSKRWHNIIQGWLLLNPQIKILNRFWLSRFNNKIYNLVIAKKIGFKVDETYVTNNISFMKEKNKNKDFILKAIDNGYCVDAEYAISNCKTKIVNNLLTSATPAFFQKKLNNPEIRIYWIIDTIYMFKIESEHLDHRVKKDAQVSFIENTNIELYNKTKNLVNILNLNYAAIDFKTNDKNEIIFLEINDFPMMAYFDKLLKGRIGIKILDFLKS